MRVLVLDEGFASGAITAFGIRRAGCVVDVIAATGGSGSCRATGGTWRLAPRVSDPRLFDVLDRTVRESQWDVVYPVTEPLQWLLWDQMPGWSANVYPQVDEGRRAALRDKQRMSLRLAESGIRIPRQLPAATFADVDRGVDELGLPIVVKGGSGRGGNSTHVCATRGAARAAARRIAQRKQRTFVQAYIAGATYLAGGVFDEGRALRFFAGVKSVQFPRRVGPAAELRSEGDATLAAVAQRVFGAAEVSGIASIDLVRDAQGTFHFLELNPRPWGSMEAARRAGVELFEALVALWRAEPPTPRLEFRADVCTPIFPLYLLAAPCWRSGVAARTLPSELHRALSLARENPPLVGHLVHRLARVCYNW